MVAFLTKIARLCRARIMAPHSNPELLQIHDKIRFDKQATVAGLRTDDVNYDEGQTFVREALRRLPKTQYYEREFRISRAIQLSLQKDILPKSEWTVYEDVCITMSYQYLAVVLISQID